MDASGCVRCKESVSNMFSCLNCRKALIAKSKSHSEISYRDEKRRNLEPLTAGDELNNSSSCAIVDDDHDEEGGNNEGQKGSEEEARYLCGQASDGRLRRSQTQVSFSETEVSTTTNVGKY